MQTSHFKLAEGVYRVTVAPTPEFSFNHFIVMKGSKPMLVHTGRSKWFEHTLAETRKIIDPNLLSYVGFSHFEADECGALNAWLEVATNAVPLIGSVGQASIEDYSSKPPIILKHGEEIDLGNTYIKFLETPHCPHNWDACMYYMPAEKILFCSDLGAQTGIPQDGLICSELIIDTIIEFQKQSEYLTGGTFLMRVLDELEKLDIEIMAIQHGNSLGKQVIRTLLSRLKSEFC